MNQILQNLITEGNQITFQNNCRNSNGRLFSDASEDLLSWVSRVEDYVRNNYNPESGPYKLFETFNRKKLNGYFQSDFENEIKILIGVLRSCDKIAPNKLKVKDDNVIMSLIKNYLFWTVLVVAVSGAYKLGFDNGNSKFDKEQIEMNKENEILKSEKKKLEQKDMQKDSVIIELKADLKLQQK